MKSKWRGNKLILILIGILFFIGLAFAEDAIKSEPDDGLLKNIRVTRSWSPTGSCISTLDAKWTEPDSWPDASKMIDNGTLQAILINRDPGTGWDKARARVYGWSDLNRTELLSRTKPIRDLIDLAIPAEVGLVLEWWDTYSQYRIMFTDAVAADIDKLNGYIVEMLFKANKKSSEWPDGKKKVTRRADNPFAIEYIRLTAGFKSATVVLNPSVYGNFVPRILDKDASPAKSSSWFRVGIGVRDEWAPKEMECFNCPEFTEVSLGGGEHGRGDTMLKPDPRPLGAYLVPTWSQSWPDPDAWPHARRNEI